MCFKLINSMELLRRMKNDAFQMSKQHGNIKRELENGVIVIRFKVENSMKISKDHVKNKRLRCGLSSQTAWEYQK